MVQMSQYGFPFTTLGISKVYVVFKNSTMRLTKNAISSLMIELLPHDHYNCKSSLISIPIVIITSRMLSIMGRA